jgi:hypothetical protein
LLAPALALFLSAGCTAGSGTSGGGGTVGSHADGGPETGSTSGASSSSSGSSGGNTPQGNPAPAALVGTWTAGRGGTTVSYDTIADTSSPSNASGLAYQFAADGTFAKAYRDSNGGSCPIIVVGTESGVATWGDGEVALYSHHGQSQQWSSCSPGAVSTEPMAESDLDRASYSYQLNGDELLLTRTSDGASATFRRSQ